MNNLGRILGMDKLGILLDASSPHHFVALVEGKKVVKWRSFSSDREMVEELQLLLKEADVEPKELSYVSSGVGPGSYTGLRVAQAVAQGLSLALKIPLGSFCSLMGFSSKKPFAALLDARVSGVYFWQPSLLEPVALSLEELKERLPEGAEIFTPWAKPLLRRLPEERWKIVEQLPNIALLAELAETSEKSFSTQKMLYLRRTEAEMKLEESKSR